MIDERETENENNQLFSQPRKSNMFKQKGKRNSASWELSHISEEEM